MRFNLIIICNELKSLRACFDPIIFDVSLCRVRQLVSRPNKRRQGLKRACLVFDPKIALGLLKSSVICHDFLDFNSTRIPGPGEARERGLLKAHWILEINRYEIGIELFCNFPLILKFAKE